MFFSKKYRGSDHKPQQNCFPSAYLHCVNIYIHDREILRYYFVPPSNISYYSRNLDYDISYYARNPEILTICIFSMI